jgi:uncharacterized protein
VQVPRKSTLDIDERLDTEDIQNAQGSTTNLQHIQVTGTLLAVQKDFLFQGSITGTFQGTCDRCIESAQAEESIDVSWLFEPGTVPDPMEDFAQSEETAEDDEEEEYSESDENEQIRYYEGDNIDLAPHVREEMVLAAPSKLYCTDDCKGLCPHCGVNLNNTTCECTEEVEQNNSGLNALKDLYPDLPSNPPEE